MKSIALCLLALAAPLTAAPLEPARLPETTRWFLHLDFDAMRGSLTGQRLGMEIEARHGADLRAFSRMFALDPLQDIRGATLFGDGREDHGVLLLDAAFDREHLTDIVAAADDYRLREEDGLEIHAWTDGGKRHHAIFIDELLVMSEREPLALEAARTLLGGPGLEGDAFLAHRPAPLMAARAELSGLPLPEEAAWLLRHARDLAMTVHEADGRLHLRLTMGAHDEALAGRLSRLLDGLVAVAELEESLMAGLDLRARVAPREGNPGVAAALSLPLGQVAGWLEGRGLLQGAR